MPTTKEKDAIKRAILPELVGADAEPPGHPLGEARTWRSRARLNTTSEVVAKCRGRVRLDCVEGLQAKPGARVARAVFRVEDAMEPWQHRSWGFLRDSGPWRVRDLRR